MEPLAKRPRMGVQSHLTNILSDDDDELNFDPEEISQRRDPGYQLQQQRGLAVNRLKSTFEHIFDKYERDFSEIGDEIDLRTGEIVVNNGHLHSMRNEKDVGDDADEDEGMLLSEMYGSDEDEDGADDDEDDEGNEEVEQLDEDAEEDRILQGRSATTQQAQEVQSASRKAWSVSRNVPVPTPIRLATQNRLASLSHSRYTPLKPSPLSSGAWEVDESLLDPAWRAPPLVQASLPAMRTPARDDSLYQLPATNGAHSVWASGSSNMEWPSGGYVPRARGPLVSSSPTRRLMPAPPEVDDEDEILMGGPAKTTVKRSGFASSAAIAEVKKPAAPGSSPLSQKKSRPNKQHKDGVASGRQRKPALSNTPRTPDSTRKEPSSKPHQTFIVAIPFRKPPTPESLTLVDDTSPRSDRTRGDSATPIPEEAVPDSPAKALGIETNDPIRDTQQPLPVPSSSPRQQTPPSLPETAASAPEGDASGTEQITQQPPPVELFSRNEIDPSYEFSDEDDLPPRKPVETVAPVLSEAAPAVVVETDVPRETEPTLKRKRGRPKGSKKQKQPPEDSLPPAIEPRGPSSPLRPPTEEQPHLPIEATLQDSNENQSFAEDAELAELEDLPDVQDLLDAEELPDVLDLPDAQDLAPLEDLLPLFDNPEAEAQPQDARPSKMPEEQDTTIASKKPLRNLTLIAPIEAVIPSPVRSDDSLGLALDAIIASQGLFDESDKNPDSSPAKPMEESPTRPEPAPRSSTRKRRRSVHFLEGEMRGDHNKTRIISTPPLRKGSSQHEDATLPLVQEASPLPEDMALEPATEMSDVHDQTSEPDQLPQPPAGGMFSARRARRRKGASLSSSPAPVVSPAMKKPAMRPAFKRLAVKEPSMKRRSLLSIALADSDDEDPLNAMSLLTAWTAGGSWSPRGAASTPPGSNKRAGGDSTRKRIAREGFGGLSTPTKRTGILAAGSPSGSVIYTPGGHARRCGVDGFRCDRDFCFTCLDG